MNRQNSDRTNLDHTITRRKFLGTTAAGSAALLTGGLTSLVSRSASAIENRDFLERTIPELQAKMASGEFTSAQLVRAYLDRIYSLNPLLHSVIETNPAAVCIAQQLDEERRNGHIRSPLHGIPVLVKDNIATASEGVCHGAERMMQTTAGSLALIGSVVPEDAFIIRRLRDAGAVILGKTNLGEWANFRGFINVYPLAVGWSARGGNTINPYNLSYTSWGSSSGSGNGVAANLCSVAVGTETDGSITGPSSVECIVGLKPTLGLVSQRGIIPISHQQDTAGPMGRSVTDVAILLNALRSPFGRVFGQPLPIDYTQFLRRGALQGARIGRDVRFFDYNYYGSGIPGDAGTVGFAEHALQVMEDLGATIVNCDTGDVLEYTDDELTALLYEFKVQIAQYLATLTNTDMRTLADLINFNRVHCRQELVYYGQEVFELAQQTHGYPTNPMYVHARQRAQFLARRGIDNALATQNLDAIVAPHLTNSTGPAVAGYPNLSLPVGIRPPSGKPAAMLMYSTFLREPKLIGFAYDLEQRMQVRRQPEFRGSVIPVPNADLCDNRTHQGEVFNGTAKMPAHGRMW
jgi:amidase